MGLFYPNQVAQMIIGTKSGTTYTGVTLESTYQNEASNVATKTFKVGGYVKVALDIVYTMGSAESSNSIEVKIEGSPDGTNFFRLPNDSTSGGTSTITAREFTFVGTNAAAANISIGIDIFYKYLRVSIKETGVGSNKGTVSVEATLSGK